MKSFQFLAVVVVLSQLAHLARSQGECGMWAGPVAASEIEDPCSTTPSYLLSGPGRFSTCCGGPGCWPSVIIRNLTKESETYMDVGGCGGGDTTYKATFHATAPQYEVGDVVQFIRANRSLSQPPVPCENSGPTVTIPEKRLADPSPTTTPLIRQGHLPSEPYGRCNVPTHTMSKYGCALCSATMVLNYHLAKHGLGSISVSEVQRLLLEEFGGGFDGCLNLKWAPIVQIGGYLGIPGFRERSCAGTLEDLNKAVCQYGPAMVYTRSLSGGRGHWVVAVSDSSNGIMIRDPGAGHPSLGAYGNEVRRCKAYSSSPASSNPSQGNLNRVAALRITSNSSQVALSITDDAGRTTGFSPEQPEYLSHIPRSRAEIDGGIDAHEGEPKSSATYFAVDVFEPADLHLLQVHAMSEEPYTISLEGQAESGRVGASKVTGMLPKGASESVAVFLAPGSSSSTGPQFSITSLDDARPPFVAALGGASQEDGGAVVGSTHVASSGVLWPVDAGEWFLRQLVFENEGSGDAEELVRHPRLFRDEDQDGQFSAMDTRVAADSFFNASGELVLTPNYMSEGPFRFFLVVDAAIASGDQKAELRFGPLAACLLAALLFVVSRVRRRLARRTIGVAAGCLVLALACSSGSQDPGPPPEQGAELQLSLTNVDIEGFDPLQALRVEGLPVGGWEIDL